MKVDSFSVKAGRYIQSLIKQRDYLISTQQSRRNPDSYFSDLNFLRTHLQANGYHLDYQMSRFWLCHHDKILNLIPGFGSPIHHSLMITYLELTKEAVSLHMQKIIEADKTLTNSPTKNP